MIINKGEPPTFDEELRQDVIEIITVFSARLDGSRSHKTKRLREDLKTEEGSARAVRATTDDAAPASARLRLLNSLLQVQSDAAPMLAERDDAAGA